MGLDRYFAFRYCAADVGAKKPDPAMFERAIAHARVRPGEAVHIGDHAIDDIEGARAGGMATIWVNLSGTGDDPGATGVISRLQDLPTAIARLG